MRFRFKLALFAAAVIFSFSVASALAPLPTSTPKDDTAQEPASKFLSDHFQEVSAPESDQRLSQGVNGSAGVSNPLPGPAAVKQPNVALPPYPGAGTSYRDQPPAPGAPGYPRGVYPDPDKKPKGGNGLDTGRESN